MPEPLEEFRVERDELPRLDQFLSERANDRDAEEQPGMPFVGGWVGFISYETGAAWEGVAPRIESSLPAALFHRHENVIGIGPDGQTPGTGSAGRGCLASESDGLSEAQRAEFPAERERDIGARPEILPRVDRIADSLEGGRYAQAHESIRDGIARGDFYQVNLTRRFRTSVEGGHDARRLFRALAGDPPPRYSALLRGPGFDVLSASPELFLRADFRSGDIEMRPIKGTAPRFEDAAEDLASSERLLSSVKDRAENVMIVDLCRNDLGRVCESGSVSVPHLCRLASHRVHHLESVIGGRLASNVTPQDVLRATFPPGSVTGAPKRAAAAAIRDFEPVARGVYTGAIGFLDRRGRMAFNVAIRTAVLRQREIDYHAGGGITWSSAVESEDRESRLKAREFFEMIAEGSRK